MKKIALLFVMLLAATISFAQNTTKLTITQGSATLRENKADGATYTFQFTDGNEFRIVLGCTVPNGKSLAGTIKGGANESTGTLYVRTNGSQSTERLEFGNSTLTLTPKSRNSNGEYTYDVNLSFNTMYDKYEASGSVVLPVKRSDTEQTYYLQEGNDQLTIAQFLANANEFDKYQLTGIVQNIVNTTFGNFDLVDDTGKIYIYGLKNELGYTQQFASMNIGVGDTLTLRGTYYLFNGTKPEIMSAEFVSVKRRNHVPEYYTLDFDFANATYYSAAENNGEAIWHLELCTDKKSADNNPKFVTNIPASSDCKLNGGGMSLEKTYYVKAAGDTVFLIPNSINQWCKQAETQVSKPIYDFLGQFYAKNGDSYTLNTTIPVYAKNSSDENITLIDIKPNLDEDGEFIKDLPLEVPNVGGNVKICAQNLRNYFVTLTNSLADCKYASCFADKTHDIVDVFHYVNADIYAINEIESTNKAVAQLVDSLNVGRKNQNYDYVVDNVESTGNGDIKSAYIYRKDRVKPIGNNGTTAPGQYVYVSRMRVQAFEHLASGAKFAVSLNHFKAKDNTADEGEAKRVNNANTLVTSLYSVAVNYPNIVIVGDLNCEMGEQPLNIIENAGYEEMLVHYNSAAFSHCYNGEQLIDHVFANASMKSHVTGAAVYHICTKCGEGSSVNYNYRYSDHDPYLVGLYYEVADAVETTEYQKSVTVFANGNTIFVKTTNDTDIVVYNLQSQIVAQRRNVDAAQFQLSQGFYLVKVGSTIEKVVVR